MKQTLTIDEPKTDILSLNGKTTIKITPTEKEVCEKYGFEVNNNSFLSIYKCIVIRGIKFTSEKSKEMSTIDYFVRLKNGSIGSVYFYSMFNSSLYALVSIHKIINQSGHFLKLKIVMKKS